MINTIFYIIFIGEYLLMLINYFIGNEKIHMHISTAMIFTILAQLLNTILF